MKPELDGAANGSESRTKDLLCEVKTAIIDEINNFPQHNVYVYDDVIRTVDCSDVIKVIDKYLRT